MGPAGQGQGWPGPGSGKLTKESTNDSVKLLNCFDKFEGENLYEVKRNGHLFFNTKKDK